VNVKLTAMALVVAASAAFAADEDPIENPRLPKLWKVVSRTKCTAAQLEAVSKKLGVAMTGLSNAVLDAGGIRLQINVATCPDETAAGALWTKFDQIHASERDDADHGGGSLHAATRGNDVAEIVCGNRLVTEKAQHVLGWNETLQRRHTGMYHEVTMRVAPLASCDSMRWNRLFNLLRKADDPKLAAAIEAEAKAFQFADRLLLPADTFGRVFNPECASVSALGDQEEFKFDALSRKHGVPFVEVTQDLPMETFLPSPPADGAGPWSGATDAWPIDAPEVRAAAAEALGKDAPASPRERVERVLAWIHEHVRYGGDEVGSRYGVVKVLKQGFGHCWDQSDVFVALCRAAGVPARQTGGWLLHSEGHVWDEVRLGDEGELAVDPGTTWLGVSADYVRLWVSDDGRMPFVYWDIPKITGPKCIR
jgi:hypothetical protein